MKNNYTPEIRFPGFTGEWELRKVIDFSEETFGGGTPKTLMKEYWNGEIPWIQSSDLHEHQVSNVFAKKKITEQGLHNSATKLIPENSIAIVTRVGVGKIALMQYEYATSQDFLSLSNLKVNEWFGVYSLYNHLQKELDNVQGTSIKGITKNELLGKKINIPTNSEEQNKIGGFFKQLDETIGLYQQELTTLKQTKQGFLQKMFPKEGEAVPEIRFPGFTGDWEQRKLSDIKDVRDGTHDSPKYYNEGFPLVTSKNLTESGLDMTNVSLISEDDFNSINKRSKVEIGDIIFGMIGTIGNPVIIDREGFAIKNVALIKHGGEVSNEFLIQQLKSPIFRKYILNENAGNTQKFLGLSKIRNYQFLSPPYKEQIIIGNFFKQLDENIALYQRELDVLKETKKAFLQKMFL